MKNEEPLSPVDYALSLICCNMTSALQSAQDAFRASDPKGTVTHFETAVLRYLIRALRQHIEIVKGKKTDKEAIELIRAVAVMELKGRK